MRSLGSVFFVVQTLLGTAFNRLTAFGAGCAEVSGTSIEVLGNSLRTHAFEIGDHLQFPNAVVLNAVGCRNMQMKRMSEKEHKSASAEKLQTTRFETTRFGKSQDPHLMGAWRELESKDIF